MDVLFVGSWYPYPPDNGARLRAYNLIKELSRRHRLDLLSFYLGDPPFAPERLEAMCRFCRSVEAVPRLEYVGHGWASLGEILAGRVPWITLRWNRDLEDRVRAMLTTKHFDLVIVSQVQNLPLLDAVEFEIPILLEQFEVSGIWQRVDQARAWTRARRVLSRSLWNRYLGRRLPKCAGITVPSPQEGDIVAQIWPAASEVALVPNGVDTADYRPGLAEPQPGVLIYQGPLEFGANYDAVGYFLKEIMPLVANVCPDARLRVTGRSEGVNVSRLAAGGALELTGYLADVRPAVASAWVCVVPLRYGAGTRLKILEAMALGTPVVTTTKGIEGIEAVPGEQALVADDPRQFARYVIDLLQDPALRARLARNARRLVEEKYGWQQIGARLNAFCEQLVGGGLD